MFFLFSSLPTEFSPTHPPNKCHLKHRAECAFQPWNKITRAQLALCKETSLLTLQNKLWQVSRDRQIKAGSEMANVAFGKQAFYGISPGYVTTNL